MSALNFNDIIAHIGHNVQVTAYGKDGKEPFFNAAIVCIDCNEVLLDYDREEEIEVERKVEREDGTIIAVEEMPNEDDLYSIFIIDKKSEHTELYEDNLTADEVEYTVNQLLNPFQRMFGVEYETEDTETTIYEIFDNLPEAIKFSKDVNWIYIFQSDMKNVYQEPNGLWNYEDKNDTLNNTKIIYENKEFKRIS